MSFFVEDMVTSAKFRSMAPISQNTFQVDDIITLADEEMLLKLVSDLFKIREDFFLRTKRTALTQNITHYRIPKRAIGNTFKVLYYVSPSGVYSPPLTKIDMDKRYLYQDTNAEPQAFFIEGDEVVLVPTPSVSAGYIEFGFFSKPNRLTATSNCAKIIGISTLAGTTTLSVNTDLTSSLSVGSQIDFLSAQSPYMLWADTVSITAITATTIAVLASDISDVNSLVYPQLNDYICPTGYANIPMVPEEFHPVLNQMVAVRLIASLGDINKWNAAKAELQEMRMEALKLVKNRVETAPTKVVSQNGLLTSFGR
jgi:hypothetical protein